MAERLHGPNSNGFYGWVFKDPNSANQHSCAITPTHIAFATGLNGQVKKIRAALDSADNASLLSIRGVTSYERSDVTLRFLPSDEQIYVHHGEKRKLHMMRTDVFNSLTAAIPGAEVRSEEYSSSSGIRIERYLVGLLPLALIAVHWIANNSDTSGVRQRFLVELVEGIPAVAFYPLMILLSGGLLIRAYTQNQAPTQSFTIDP